MITGQQFMNSMKGYFDIISFTGRSACIEEFWWAVYNKNVQLISHLMWLLHCYYPAIITQTLPPILLCQTGLYQNMRWANLCWHCKQGPELSKWRKRWGTGGMFGGSRATQNSANNSKLEVFLSSWWKSYCHYFVIISWTLACWQALLLWSKLKKYQMS